MGGLRAQRLAGDAHHVWLGWLRPDSRNAGDRVFSVVRPGRNTSPLAPRFNVLAGTRGLSAPRAVRFSIPDLFNPGAFSVALRGAVLSFEEEVSRFALRTVRSPPLPRAAVSALSPICQAPKRRRPHRPR